MQVRTIPIGPIVRIAILGIGAIACGFGLWTCRDMEKLHAFLGVLALFIVLVPLLFQEQYDLFSPWSFVIIPILFFCTPQAVCTTFLWPDYETVEKMMLLGREPDYFVYPGGIHLLGLISLSIGYFGFNSVAKSNVSIRRRINHRNAMITLSVTLVLSLLATVAFIRATGGVESGRISDKRTNLQTAEVKGSDTQQYGHLRQASKVASVVFVVLYCIYLGREEKISLLETSFLLLAFLAAIALPFYASSRQQVCWVILNALGVNYYLGKGNFFAKCALIGVIGLTLFLVMSQLRAKDSDTAMESASFAKSFESVILNRNGPGLSKTSHIVNHIPDPLEYQYGSTFAEWLLAPIPRAIYRDKPMIGRGLTIGRNIYGMKYSGVPPGYIAELYWNFHIPGVIFGMVLLGWTLKWLYQLFVTMRVPGPVKLPVYLFAVMPIAFTVLSNSLGYGTMMRFVDFVTAAGIVYFCTSTDFEQ